MNYNKFKFIINSLICFIIQFYSTNIFSQTFTLNGKINGIDSGYAFLNYFRNEVDKNKTDTAIIKYGEFRFKGNISGADFAQLRIESSQNANGKKYNKSFFIEPGIINFLANSRKIVKPVITGSKTQKEYEKLIHFTSKESIKIKRFSDSINIVRSKLKSGIISPEVAEKEITIITEKHDPVLIAKRNKEINYIVEHPNSYVSILMIYSLVGYIPLDSIDILYNSISDKIKGSSMDLSFLAYNTRYRNAIAETYPFDNLKINEKAPSFLLYNTFTKDSMKLSDFDGKIFVLEFWGLFCFPCLKFNPHLEEFRKKYGSDNLNIIAINDNSKKEYQEVISYINKNNFQDWYHVFLNESVSLQNEIIYKGDFSNYIGLGVPRTIVIDKKGNVIYKKYGYSEKDLPGFKSIIEKAINDKY